jgi:hypothetical protein
MSKGMHMDKVTTDQRSTCSHGMSALCMRLDKPLTCITWVTILWQVVLVRLQRCNGGAFNRIMHL